MYMYHKPKADINWGSFMYTWVVGRPGTELNAHVSHICRYPQDINYDFEELYSFSPII